MLHERTTGDPDVRWFSVPGQRLAVARHCGPFADLDRTYGTLGRHVLERGLCAEGPIRKVYLVTPADTDDPQGLRSDVCWPVVEGSAADPDPDLESGSEGELR